MMKFIATIVTLILCLFTNTSQANLIINGDFSDNTVAENSYSYWPNFVANGWNFNTGTGVIKNASVWSVFTSDKTLAFLALDATNQNATISQTFTAPSNTYFNIAFDLANRSGYGELSVNVFLNGVVVNKTPLKALSATSYTNFSINPVLASSSGSNILSFKILNPTNPNDSSVFLDNVNVTTVAVVSEPEVGAMMMLGLGLMGFLRRRRAS